MEAVAHIVTGALGFVAGLFTPWVKWGIEKRRLKLQHRRELVARWRRMIQTIAQSPAETDVDVTRLLESHEDFYSLQPHLSSKALGQIHRGTTWLAGSTIGAALQYMLDDIARIEKEWGLV
jgi:predicted YcjX-like family ATPase